MKRALPASCALLAVTFMRAASSAVAEPTARSNGLAELSYYNWAGMYVGGSFGWGGGYTHDTVSDFGAPASLLDHTHAIPLHIGNTM